ncbi:MAG: hypothetical protein ACI4CT_00625 [Lachnospiraceae bacterium]
MKITDIVKKADRQYQLFFLMFYDIPNVIMAYCEIIKREKRRYNEIKLEREGEYEKSSKKIFM